MPVCVTECGMLSLQGSFFWGGRQHVEQCIGTEDARIGPCQRENVTGHRCLSGDNDSV